MAAASQHSRAKRKPASQAAKPARKRSSAAQPFTAEKAPSGESEAVAAALSAAPGAQLDRWPLSRLIPYARNPRRNDGAVQRMVGLIREFGFVLPVLARSDGEVIDGHLRLKAAYAMGLEAVPVLVADHLTPAQVKAFRIAVNRSVAWAEWDEELLAGELHDLNDAGFDLELTGFDSDEVAKLLGAEAEIAAESPPDDFPSVGDWVSTEYKCPRCSYEWSGKPK